MDSQLTLSEAIRLGAMLRPQAFGAWVDEGGTCATGAALESIGWPLIHKYDVNNNQHVMDGAKTLHERWPWARADKRGCPACRFRQLHTIEVIEHLNDNHRWSRERIAEWVQTIEQQQTGEAGIVAGAQHDSTSLDSTVAKTDAPVTV